MNRTSFLNEAPAVLRRNGWMIAAACAAALATLAALARLPRFAAYRAHPLLAALLFGAGLALVLAPRGARVLDRIARAAESVSPAAFGLFLFVVGTVFYALVSWRVFGALPVLDDDTCSLMQARIFLSGRVTIPLSPNPDFFWLHFWLNHLHGLPHQCAMYPPGHPALLAVGLAVGAPWLVMPVFGGLLAVLVSSVGRLLFDEESARLAGLLCVLSPMVCELSATHLAHAPTACGLLLAARGVLRCLERPSWADGALAGLGICLAFQCRTADAAVAGGGRPVLCFIDEVLRGTNTVERIAASAEILGCFADRGVTCFAATHDIELTGLLQDRFENYHFQAAGSYSITACCRVLPIPGTPSACWRPWAMTPP